MTNGLKPLANVLFISGGALIGQVAVILTMPLITRLYDPSEMGEYAVFVGFVGIFGTIISLHYELAIPLPKTKAAAARVAMVAMLATVGFSLVIGILLLAGGLEIAIGLTGVTIGNTFWFLPACLAITGFCNVLTFWAIRERAFLKTATSKAFQGIGQAVPQIFAGVGGAGVGGLVAGQIVGPAAGLAAFLSPSDLRNFRESDLFSWRRLVATAKRYRKFPLFTTWSSLINALGAHLPVMVLASIFGAAVTGQFALSYRLLQVPLRLLGLSVSQVFLGGVAGARQTTDLSAMTHRTFRLLVAFGLPSFAVIGWVATDLFVIVFGRQWEQAGLFGQLLIPWLFASFVATVLSVLVSVLQKQAQELTYQVGYVLCSVLALAAGAQTESSELAVALIGLLGGTLLTIKIFWLLRLVGISSRTGIAIVLVEAGRAVPVLLILAGFGAWIGSGYPMVLAAAVLLVAVHYWNYRFREVYTLHAGNAT